MGPRGARLQAIEAAYRRDYARFLRVAEGVTREPSAAADAVQEGFARAIRSRRAYRGDGPIEAWLWRAVVNAARDEAARRERRAGAAPAVAPAGPGDAALDLAGPIARLPERQRLALFLRYYADLDYRSIARVLGVEVGTVSATLSAAHATLRRLLVEEEVPR